MKKRSHLFIFVTVNILIIIASLYVFFVITRGYEKFHDYGSVTVKDLNRKEFNDIFSTDIVLLPINICGVGIDNSNIYLVNNPSYVTTNGDRLYTTDGLIPYLMKHIVPKLSKSKFYFLYNTSDGHGERLDIRSNINYYNAKEEEFSGKSEINLNELGQYPLLHRKKYVLTNCKLKKDMYAKAIPDRYFILSNAQDDLVNNMLSIRKNIAWANKKKIGVWRGKLSNGSKTNFIEQKVDMSQRELFVDLYKKGALKNVDYSEESLTKEKMCEYKYLIDIDGWSNTWDATIWKMLSGSILLKVGGVWEQWYYDKLNEWVHYVPVKDDLSDLNEKVQWCIDNDEKCKTISENAYKFVTTELTFEKARDYTIEIFNKYVV
jgi:Glycosyl transferase family 90